MHEIFISYSSRHRDLTRQLAEAIETQYGPRSVWWDHELEARGAYHGQIRAALDAARVVVVVWAAGALVSDYVYAEAVRAHEAHKLVNVRPADVGFAQIPEPFNIHHVEEATSTERILRAVASVMAGRQLPTRVPLHELYWRQHGQRVLDAKQAVLPADVLDISPSQLLQARYEHVTYLDATGQRAALLDWALRHPRRAAGRLLHGPGGVGKTRLLIELAHTLRRDHGWAAGFVERPPASATQATRAQRRQALEQLIALGEEPGLLLVMDYAEGRQDEVLELAGWIDSRAADDARPVRLVLLARSAGDWWERLRDDHLPMQPLFVDRPGWPGLVALPPFESPEQRLTLFDASRAAYAQVLRTQGRHRPAADAPAELRNTVAQGEQGRRPLAIQMAALVWLADAPAADGDAGVAGLLDQVLGLERRHWAQVLGELDEAARTALERGLAQVTLVQGVSEDGAAESLLMLDGHYAGHRAAPVDVAPVLSRLKRLYGHAEGGLLALEPDLVGEHLVAKVGDVPLLDGCIAWVEREPEPGVAAPSTSADRSLVRRRLVTVLQRATHGEHGTRVSAGACRLVDRLILSHLAKWAEPVVATIVETPGELLNRLGQHLPTLRAEALAALDGALPLRSLTLDALALSVADRGLADLQAAQAQDSTKSPAGEAKIAARHLIRGVRLLALGRLEEALPATDKAVQIYRRLADSRPDVLLPDLARSLDNLGIVLSYFGRREDALDATDEAVQIRRRLAESQPDAFLPGLAQSLNNLASMLASLDRRKDALTASDEAVQIRRRLAQSQPDAFLPDLALSLNNLADKLSALGRREDALAIVEEAVQTYRRLADGDPGAFLLDLTIGLHNLGGMLARIGRGEDALVAYEEAVQIRRSLAGNRPDAFLPGLAESLTIQGELLAYLGRRDNALATYDEAVQMYRNLAESRPDAFLPGLAQSLNSLASMLADLDRHEDALTATAQVVQIRRRLAESQPGAFLPELARSLGNLCTRLSAVGRREDALAATDEAVQIYRCLAGDRPDAFLPGLATSLNNRGKTLSETDRLEDALAATDESVQIYRHLADSRPDAFLPDLAGSLAARSMALANAGRLPEAAAAAEEGLAALLPVARRYPEAVADLALSIARAHIQHAEAAHQDPNESLLAEVSQALGLNEPDTGPTAENR